MSDGYGHDGLPESPFNVGRSVLIMTVTHYWTGRIVSIGAHEIVLCDAAWIPDLGRFYEALSSGNPSEVEPIPDGIASVLRGPSTVVLNWNHELPRTVK